VSKRKGEEKRRKGKKRKEKKRKRMDGKGLGQRLESLFGTDL